MNTCLSRASIMGVMAAGLALPQQIPPYHAEYFRIQEAIKADNSSTQRTYIGTVTRASSGSWVRQYAEADGGDKGIRRRKELFDAVSQSSYTINDDARTYVRIRPWKPLSSLLRRPRRTDVAEPKMIEGLLCHAFPIFGNGAPGNRDRVGIAWVNVEHGIDVLEEMDYVKDEVRFRFKHGIRAIRFGEPPPAQVQIPLGYTLTEMKKCCGSKK